MQGKFYSKLTSAQNRSG